MPFRPGISESNIFASGIHLPLREASASFYQSEFDIDIPLKGSEELYFIPIGENTEVTMTSNWKDPSFIDAFPTKSSEISGAGFKATWQVLHFNRNFPQSWIGTKYYVDQSIDQSTPYEIAVRPSANEQKIDIGASKFGVNLLVAADHYQKSMRTSKYAVLIIALSFLIFFLIEITQRYRIHPFQYILVGLTLLVFYTLLLSISEHLGYNAAYWISSLSVIALIASYAVSVLGNRRMASLLAASLLFIYSFIFIIIQIETYALLVGSIGLFVILALTMYFTRKISWYRMRE
ncbi:MAG: cell envelope integrity protein CreD [Cyclobacteriaceae bacterium]|nr:cell envelope integrity protein CreD [Cyclobacteriaceae bacterium]